MRRAFYLITFILLSNWRIAISTTISDLPSCKENDPYIVYYADNNFYYCDGYNPDGNYGYKLLNLRGSDGVNGSAGQPGIQGTPPAPLTENSSKIGISNATPTATLDVNGEIKVEYSSTTACVADKEGSLRYNSDDNIHEFCSTDGGTYKWRRLGSIKSSTIPELILNTQNGKGTTHTAVLRFSSVVKNTGTAWTYADSAANGTTITINESGLYSLMICGFKTGDGLSIGITVDDTRNPITNMADQLLKTANHITSLYSYLQGSYYLLCGQGVAYLNANQVVRPLGGSTGGNNLVLRIVKIY